MRKQLGDAEVIADLEQPNGAPNTVRPETARRVEDTQAPLLERYFDLLASEDDDIDPATPQMYPHVAKAKALLAAAAPRPQTSTITQLVAEIRGLDPVMQAEPMRNALARLERELQKTDSQLHGDIEGEEEAWFAQNIGTKYDSLLG